MSERRKRMLLGGITDQNVEMAKPPSKNVAEFIDCGRLTKILRNKGGFPSMDAHPVVHFFEATGRPCHENETCAFPSEPLGEGSTKTARSPRDQGQASIEPPQNQASSSISGS